MASSAEFQSEFQCRQKADKNIQMCLRKMEKIATQSKNSGWAVAIVLRYNVC